MIPAGDSSKMADDLTHLNKLLGQSSRIIITIITTWKTTAYNIHTLTFNYTVNMVYFVINKIQFFL